MELQPLTVATREKSGTGSAKKFRAQEKLPGVVYGIDDEPVSILIELSDFIHLVHSTGGEHALIDLTFEDNPKFNCRAMIKDVQHHPIRGDFLHADLLRIDMKKKITTYTRVEIEGHAKGVIDGGMIDHQTREIHIECLPTDVPDSIVVDITDLEIGQNVIMRDIPMPDGVTSLEPEDRSVVAIHPPRVLQEALGLEEEGEEAEGEEGEGEAAEGDAEEGNED